MPDNNNKINQAFKLLRSKDTLVLEMNVKCKASNTRTKCSVAPGTINKKPVFIKYSPCTWKSNTANNTHATNRQAASASPTSCEVKFYNITNAFNKLNICDTFAWSYTPKYLKSHIHRHPFLSSHLGLPNPIKLYSTMLITEHLSDYMTLHEFMIAHLDEMQKDVYILKNILFQIVYTIQCMGYIHMAHMDLHFKNIYVRKNVKDVGNYKSFTYYTKNNTLKTAHIPAGIDVKIIDLDGAHKLDAGSRVRTIFRTPIRNKFIFSGRAQKTNPRTNLIKVAFQFRESSKTYKITKNNISEIAGIKGKVPFFNRNMKSGKLFKTRNKHLANKFGIFVKAMNNNVINVNNDVIVHPSVIIEQLSSYFTKTDGKIISSFSQKLIFNKKGPIQQTNITTKSTNVSLYNRSKLRPLM
jgi:hypothetical protein